MSLLCVFTFSQIAWSMSTVIGFYVLPGRWRPAVHGHEPLAVSASASWQFIRTFVDALAFLLPDLDRFTESEC